MSAQLWADCDCEDWAFYTESGGGKRHVGIWSQVSIVPLMVGVCTWWENLRGSIHLLPL